MTCKQNEEILLLTSRGLTSPLGDQGVDVHQGHEQGVWLVESWLLAVIGSSIGVQTMILVFQQMSLSNKVTSIWNIVIFSYNNEILDRTKT